jgi:excisionase family DNA binding protein
MGRLVTIAELAARSGTCESTWRKAIAREEIPVIRIGRAVRIAEEVAERLIREGTARRTSGTPVEAGAVA